MNKLRILFFLVFIGCTSSKKIYKIKWNTKYPIVIKRYTHNNRIIVSKIKYPIKIVLKNSSFRTKELIDIEYFLGTGGSGFIFLNKEENNRLIPVKHKTRNLYMFQKKEFIAYATSYVDTTKVFQHNFKPYLDKMLLENKDTLHVFVDKFRKDHPNLLKEITKGDEISILIKNEGGFIPADWEDK